MKRIPLISGVVAALLATGAWAQAQRQAMRSDKLQRLMRIEQSTTREAESAPANPMPAASVRTFVTVPTGTSPHPYTILYARNHQFAYNPDLDLLVFIHRNNTYRYGGPTGHYRIDYSTTKGATWVSDVGPITQVGGGSINPRYPEVLIWNPPGNTVDTNAYVIYAGMYHDGASWIGITHGIAKVTGSYIGPQKTLALPGWGTTGFAWGTADTFWTCHPDWAGGFYFLKGWITGTAPNYEDSIMIDTPIVINDLDTNGTGSGDDAGVSEVAFTAKGDILVAAAIADRTIENPEDSTIDVYRPFLIFSLDHGQTWTITPEIPIYNYTNMLSMVPDTLIDGTDTFYATSWSAMFDVDVVIDAADRAHVIFPLAFGMRVGGDYVVLVPPVLGIVDVVYDLNANAVDTVLYLGDVNAFVPYEDSDGDRIGTRPIASASALNGGERIVVTWLDDVDTPDAIVGNSIDLVLNYVDYDPTTDQYTVGAPFSPSAGDAVWSGKVYFQQVAQPLPGEDCGTGYAGINVTWMYGEIDANPGDTIAHHYWADPVEGLPLPVIVGRSSYGYSAYVSCHGDSDGWFKVMVPILDSLGIPYTVEIDTGAGWMVADSVGNLAPGVYYARVIKGCDTATIAVTIIDPAPLVVTINATPPSSQGASDGVLSASVSGGMPPYDFIWSTGHTGMATVSGVDTGTYWVQVIDAHGCEAYDTITVTVPVGVVTAGETRIWVVGRPDGLYLQADQPIAEVRLYTVDGRTLAYRTDINRTAVLLKGTLPQGIYILEVVTQDGEKATMRVATR